MNSYLGYGSGTGPPFSSTVGLLWKPQGKKKLYRQDYIAKYERLNGQERVLPLASSSMCHGVMISISNHLCHRPFPPPLMHE